MRAWAQFFILGRRWPALGNVTRRKPWGLEVLYGESATPAVPRVLRDGEVFRCLPSTDAFEFVLQSALSPLLRRKAPLISLLAN